MDAIDKSGGHSRLFTLAEANALLPRVREQLGAIQSRAAQVSALHERLEAFREQKRRSGHAVEGESRLVLEALQEADRIGAELRSSIQELLDLGCELKDVQMGLVDFPARREDRTVYLCWRLGEDEIRYWHELDTGFSGRQPL
ncbi:MAG TPA: DUF2203 domain-containing protein [Chloroflexota bacterium]|nr:DUF2203 domain-containing protein [Chloroflexota bacterium]